VEVSGISSTKLISLLAYLPSGPRQLEQNIPYPIFNFSYRDYSR